MSVLNVDLPFLAGYNHEDEHLPLFPEIPERKKTASKVVIYDIDAEDPMGQAIAHLHERYRIPSSREPEAARLVQNYIRAAHVLDATWAHWKSNRGTHGHDVEYLLLLETQELTSVMRSLREFDAAACALGEFLTQFKVKPGDKKKPGWLEVSDRDFNPEMVDS